jgi:hypothetical protein
MAFEKLNEVDLQILDDIYEFAKRCEYIDDIIYFKQQVELLIGDLESPVAWQKYMHKLEEIYGYKNK